MDKEIIRLNLRLFDGESGGESGAAEGEAQSQGESNAPIAPTRRSKKAGAYDNVRFGVQEDQAQDAQDTQPAQENAAGSQEGPKPSSNTLDDKRKAFQDLIRGEYKDIYTEETQRIIDRRFKETKQLQAHKDSVQPLIDMLMSRYGIANGDLKALHAAVEGDDALIEAKADEAGMTPEQYRQLEKLKLENRALREADEAKRSQEQAQAKAQQWYTEAEALRAKFPAFDLATELQDQRFVSMLKAGTPVEHAYKVMHFDEIMGSTIQAASAKAEQAVANNIRARGSRPVENGSTAQSAFTVKDDVTKLSRADRAEIVKRVQRGERVVF